MDGTLVDTEPYWLVAEKELVSSFGGTWTDEDGLQLVGSGLWHSARILQAKGVELSENDIIEHLTSRVLEQVDVAVPWRPGARELLLELRELGVPAALVTMSIRRMAEHVAAAVGFNGFAAIIGGDDVEHSKPHPQPYLLGAEALGVSATDCLALEDSAPGVASAVAAGTVTVAVPMHVPLIEDPTYDIHDMSGLTAAALFDIYAARRA